MADSYSKYQYKNLIQTEDEDHFSIRLIYLEPSPHHATPLKCSVQHACIRNLEDRPEELPDTSRGCIDESQSVHYDALSYVWGEPVFSAQLDTGEGIIAITESLDTALRYLRGTDKVVVLWADAVCIDQTNPEDKSVQIPQIGRTFSHATNVRVWMGSEPEPEAANKLFRSLEAFAEYEIGFERWPDVISRTTSSDIRHLLYRHGHSLSILINHELFSRKWIIQEIMLGRNIIIHYGDQSRPWESIERGLGSLKTYLSLFNMNNQLSQDTSHALKAIVNFRSESPVPFVDFILQCSTFRCRQPEDHIFALLGLLERDYFPYIKQYFHKVGPESSLFDVYLTFAGLCLKDWDTNSLCRLSMDLEPSPTKYVEEDCDIRYLSLSSSWPPIQRGGVYSDKWPSWVADWRSEISCDPFSYPLSFSTGESRFWAPHSFKSYASANMPRDMIHINMASRLLRVQGLGFDIVESTEHLTRYVDWLDETHIREDDYVERTTPEIHPAEDDPTRGGLTNFFIRAFVKHQASQEGNTSYNVFMGCTRGRCLIRTSRGLVGMGPAAARPGDIIFIISRSRYPTVLRPDLEQEVCFRDNYVEVNGELRVRLIGDAYIDGIMYGQAMEMIPEEYRQSAYREVVIC